MKKFKFQIHNHKDKLYTKIYLVVGTIASSIVIGQAINDFEIPTDHFVDNIKTIDNNIVHVYSEVITPSFKDSTKNETNSISEISIDDNNCIIQTTNGEVIKSSFDNLILSNPDVKSGQSNLPKKFRKYNNAIINYYDELKTVPINSLSVGDEDGNIILVTNSIEGEILTSVENTIPFREIPFIETHKYQMLGEDADIYICIDEKLLSFDKFIGLNAITIDGNEFMLVCVAKDNKYYEYMTIKEQLLIIREAAQESSYEHSNGKTLNFGKITGHFNLDDNNKFDKYKQVKSIFLSADSMYHLITDDNHEIIVSPKYYNINYEHEEKSDYSASIMKLDQLIPPATGDCRISHPLYNEGFYLANWYDSYLYLINDEQSGLNGIGSIYTPNSIVITKDISRKQVDNTYTDNWGFTSFVADLNGMKMGDFSDDTYSTLYAYKEINLSGIEYYSIITQEFNGASFVYKEQLIPKECVIIKEMKSKVYTLTPRKTVKI